MTTSTPGRCATQRNSIVVRMLSGAGPYKVLVTSRHTQAGLGARLVDVTILYAPL